MIGRLNHVAIAVKDLEASTALYRDTLGARVSQPQVEPEHGVTVVFVELPNTKIELLEPLGADSPIAKFLERNADGGIHHICYEVDDILAARERSKAAEIDIDVAAEEAREVVAKELEEKKNPSAKRKKPRAAA